MSKIGKKPINIPEEVNAEISQSSIVIKGPKGELSLKLPSSIIVENKIVDEKKILLVKRTSSNRNARMFHGLYRSLINNMAEGVFRGFEKKLELHVIGYQANLVEEGGKQKLVLSLGFSHPIEFVAPSGIVFSASRHSITVSGIDKQLVGQAASSVRALRPPEPYKGKGIRYAGEKVRKKPGKAVVKTTGG